MTVCDSNPPISLSLMSVTNDVKPSISLYATTRQCHLVLPVIATSHTRGLSLAAWILVEDRV
jgi:hypothetical protein